MQNTTSKRIAERFGEKIKINPDTGCWEWTACREPNGYGRFGVDGGTDYAHRVAYRMHVGPIPHGLDLDHLCRVRHCVNPEHLEPVTRRENLQRGQSGQYNAAKTHCPQGHPYAGANLLITRQGKRQCRDCSRIAQAAYRARKALAIGGGK